MRERSGYGKPITPASPPGVLDKLVVTYLRYSTGFVVEIDFTHGRIGVSEARDLAVERALCSTNGCHCMCYYHMPSRQAERFDGALGKCWLEPGETQP
jgi:hypothetical protein